MYLGAIESMIKKENQKVQTQMQEMGLKIPKVNSKSEKLVSEMGSKRKPLYQIKSI